MNAYRRRNQNLTKQKSIREFTIYLWNWYMLSEMNILCCSPLHASCRCHAVNVRRCTHCICRKKNVWFVFFSISFACERYILVVWRGSNENRVINNAFIQSVNNASDVNILSLFLWYWQDPRHSNNIMEEMRRSDCGDYVNYLFLSQTSNAGFACKLLINEKWALFIIVHIPGPAEHSEQ